MLLPRRTFLLATAAAAGSFLPARGGLSAVPPAAPPALLDLEVRDISVAGDRSLGRRFVLLLPKHLAEGERVPLLVLLHGLGETGDERTGAYAWLERYGLGAAYERLRRPPVKRTAKRGDFSEARLGEVNAALGARPFKGLAIACPYTPNVGKLGSPAAALDGYAKWLAEEVIPRARKEGPILGGAANTGLDGCSLGGYVGLEVFVRRPDLFGSWGGVQAAFGGYRAASYADRVAAALGSQAPRSIRLHFETSTGDPFREGNTELSNLLTKRGILNELLVLPGPHDQPWLREAGTLEMLLWHDRMRA